MNQLHSSVFDNQCYFCNNPLRLRFSKYIILVLFLIWILSVWLIPSVIAEDNKSDINNLDNLSVAINRGYVDGLLQQASECFSSDYIAFKSDNSVCALASLESAHNILPDDTDILLTQYYYLSYYKRYNEALDKIDAGLALDPENPDFLYEKGTILNRMGKYTESGPYFDQAEEGGGPDYKARLTDRFPANFLIHNLSFILIIIGFCILVLYIYLRERWH